MKPVAKPLTSTTTASLATSFKFGTMQIPSQLVFLQKQYTYCMIPITTLLPGHIIIVPKRQVIDFKDLEPGEIFDISLTIRSLSRCLEKEFSGTSSTVYVQSYSKNENSIDHCFVHLLPRRPGDMKQSDDIYKFIDNYSFEFVRQYNNTIALNNGYSQKFIDSLAQEASKYREFIQKKEQK